MSKQIRGISLRMEILWRYRNNGAGYEIQQFRQDENFCRTFYNRAKDEMLNFKSDGQMSIVDFPEVMP